MVVEFVCVLTIARNTQCSYDLNVRRELLAERTTDGQVFVSPLPDTYVLGQ